MAQSGENIFHKKALESKPLIQQTIQQTFLICLDGSTPHPIPILPVPHWVSSKSAFQASVSLSVKLKTAIPASQDHAETQGHGTLDHNNSDSPH